MNSSHLPQAREDGLFTSQFDDGHRHDAANQHHSQDTLPSSNFHHAPAYQNVFYSAHTTVPQSVTHPSSFYPSPFVPRTYYQTVPPNIQYPFRDLTMHSAGFPTMYPVANTQQATPGSASASTSQTQWTWVNEMPPNVVNQAQARANNQEAENNRLGHRYTAQNTEATTRVQTAASKDNIGRS
jgi:hypothetical protein